jgi:AP-3 complex subunit delta-1
MCRDEKYYLVSDFAWYISVLLDLAVMQGSLHGKEVADQLIEICLRVDSIRPFAVEKMLSMLLNDTLFFGQARSTVAEVLKSAAWILGEYCSFISLISQEATFRIEGIDGEETLSVWQHQALHFLIIRALINPKATNLSYSTQVIYLQAAFKLFVSASESCSLPQITDCVSVLRRHLSIFLQVMSLSHSPGCYFVVL